MRRKAANTRIRQDTTPTSYPTHIGVLKDMEEGTMIYFMKTIKRQPSNAT